MFMSIKSIAISGVLTLNMHALNNEGTEGNFCETRQVEVIDKEGNLYTVNAISGDMFKHIMVEHMQNLVKNNDVQVSFCKGCNVLDANRINADEEFIASFKDDATEEAILSKMIRYCAGDDLNGILITQAIGGKKRSIGRKSVTEFSWVIGLPDSVRTENYFHVKFDTQRRKSAGGSGEGANLGQSIFHRPANSGQYAVIVGADLYKIGLNDISLENVLDEEEQKKRTDLLLQSLLFTFLKPTGALRNTQNPHIVDFKGVISVSKAGIPAPTVSPLNKNFLSEIDKIAHALNEIHTGAIDLYPFESLSEYAEKMKILRN